MPQIKITCLAAACIVEQMTEEIKAKSREGRSCAVEALRTAMALVISTGNEGFTSEGELRADTSLGQGLGTLLHKYKASIASVYTRAARLYLFGFSEREHGPVPDENAMEDDGEEADDR